MNHDRLRDAMHSAVMAIYRVLYDEYLNEECAKKQTAKLAKDIMDDFYPKGDLLYTYSILLEKYKISADEVEKHALYQRLEILQQAIKIVSEEATTGE